MNIKHQNNRLLVVFVFFSILFFSVVLRLYLLQITRHDFFATLATQQYESEVTMQPARGLIYDRKRQNSLVYNSEVISAFMVPNKLEEGEKIKAWLKTYAPLVFKRVKDHPHTKFCWVERCLSPERLEQLSSLELKDLHYVTESQRFYALPAMAPLLGFTNIDNKGIAGIELVFDKRLGGKPATFKLGRDGRSNKGFYFTKELAEQGVAGKPVVLTIDAQLQFLAYEELSQTVQEFGAKSGSVIIMNPDNGQILAMASFPTFDPNAKHISLDATKNQPVTECYEFGSVMKTFTALGALEEGLVTNDELIDCQGDGCWLQGLRVTNPFNAGVLPFIDVMNKSSNVGLAKVALRMGPKLYEHLQRVGFGIATGLAFPGERSGFLNKPSKWSRFSPMVMSFGYEVSATLLQLAKAFSIISNGGFDVDPQLYLVPKPRKIKKQKRLYKPQTIVALKEILEKIGLKYPIPGYRVMGKTGTARCVKDGKYSTQAHVYTFGGLVEAENYKRVVVTFINEPVKAHMWASKVAAPLFQRIAQKMVLTER